MLQEIVEGKWIASFVRVFTLNGIEKDTQVVIVEAGVLQDELA